MMLAYMLSSWSQPMAKSMMSDRTLSAAWRTTSCCASLQYGSRFSNWSARSWRFATSAAMANPRKVVACQQLRGLQRRTQPWQWNPNFKHRWLFYDAFFPRVSERRVLLKVEVCYTSSHAHIFTPLHVHTLTSSLLYKLTSSHLHIFTPSRLHIFTSSHVHHLLTFTYSHLHIFISYLLSLSPLPSVTVSLLLFLFSLNAAGSADKAPRYGQPFAGNEVRVSKTDGLCDFISSDSAATLSHEKRFECLFCDFTSSAATLSHKTRFECQKLAHDPPAARPAQRIRRPADQRTNGSADQRISGSADQRISGSADQRISGPADQRISGPADQRISAPVHQQTSRSAGQRTSRSAEPGQRVSRWADIYSTHQTLVMLRSQLLSGLPLAPRSEC